MDSHLEPVCRFYKMIPEAPDPARADPSADGMLTMRAFRHCEAVRLASSLGWYVFPPLNFSLQFDGEFVWWTHEESEEWEIVDGQIFPGHDDVLRNVPPAPAGLIPAFLTPLREPGTVQIWSGLFARLAAEYMLLSRGPVNMPHMGYDHFEGLVDTTLWFGPVFSNIRLKSTGVSIHFHTSTPLFQVQALPFAACRKQPAEVLGLDDLSTEDWDAYEQVLSRAANHERQLGAYGAEVRRRARNAA